MTFPWSDRTTDLLRRMVEGGYLDAAGPVVDALTKPDPQLNKRLDELRAEAGRLQAAGQPLTPDNAYVVAFLNDFEKNLKVNADALNQSSEGMIQKAGAQAGKDAQQLPLLFTSDPGGAAYLMADWQIVSPEAIAELTDILTSPEWTEMLDGYSSDILASVQKLLINGFVSGTNPLQMVDDLLTLVGGMPFAQAESLLRTLYLTAYRRATVASYLENADILEYHVWVATLDNRVCISCVVKHGTKLPLNQVVNDHHRGRCTSVAKIKGIPLNVPTGVDWFNSLPPGQQIDKMGYSAWLAWQDGAIDLSDYPTPYTDPVFGEMLAAASLKKLLGPQAEKYYQQAKQK